MTSRRLHNVDAVRGLVMALMVLDHARDYLVDGNPTDLETTTVPLFFTRWITHLCAPTFVFLAGTSAWLQQRHRGWSASELSRHLVVRGFWLIVLDVFVLRVLWWFNFDYRWILLGVLWAIGWSMIALAACVRAGRRFVVGLALGMIVFHNAFDGFSFETIPGLHAIWTLLHVQKVLMPANGWFIVVAYPLVPWIGVLLLGYGTGELLAAERPLRNHILMRVGVGMVVAFVMFRLANGYADPQPWAAQKTAMATVLSFLNCTKYPPSLCYLLMTLGPMCLLLVVTDRESAWTKPLRTLGRAPLFFYLVHLPMAHAAGVLFSLASYGRAEWWFKNPPFEGMPEDYGWGLPALYAVWLGIVIALVPACRWFTQMRRTRSV